MIRKQFSYKRLYRLHNGRCFYCNTHLDPFVYENKNKRRHGWTRDHFLPKSLGYNLAGNCVLACRTCNSRKGDSIPTPPLFHKMVLIYSAFADGPKPEIVEFLNVQRLIDWPIRG